MDSIPHLTFWDSDFKSILLCKWVLVGTYYLNNFSFHNIIKGETICSIPSSLLGIIVNFDNCEEMTQVICKSKKTQ